MAVPLGCTPLTFILAATLDTKGKETAYCRDLIASRGHIPLVIDIGILGDAAIVPDIDRHAVAAAAGTDIKAILARGSKNDAILTMREGVTRIARELVAAGKAHGILGLGGGQGTVMLTGVMRELPFGFPKVMVSVIANGGQTFGPLVGTSDIAIIHSVADILGLNIITRRVLAEGVGAVIGMSEIGAESAQGQKIAVGLTTAGVTTLAAMQIRELLEARGIEAISFHCNGVGQQAMENLVAEGRIQGVIDLSPKDVIDGLYGGIFPAYAQRLQPIRAAGIPYILIPGLLDFILYGPAGSVPAERRARKYVIHNPLHTHVRTDYAEMHATARWMLARLAGGPVAVMIPTRGFGQLNIAGGPMFDPQADAGFAAGVRQALAEAPQPSTRVEEFDLHINDPAFASAVAQKMAEMLAEQLKTKR